mmetsp:Transcript_22855/g.31951  ORF Transcript_22855/g.31951 Transcript_22855/m.31951 type:complete len:95 (-) Transcript_22855:242-526(-)
MNTGPICSGLKSTKTEANSVSVRGIGINDPGIALMQQGAAREIGIPLTSIDTDRPMHSPTNIRGKTGPPTTPKPIQTAIDTTLQSPVSSKNFAS